MGPWTGRDLHPKLPSQDSYLVWLGLAQVLYMLLLLLWVCICNFPAICRRYCRVLPLTIQFGWHNLSVPLLWALEEEVIIHISFKNVHSTISYFQTPSQLWIFVLISDYWKEKFLWWELRQVLIYGYSDTSLKGGLIFCPDSKIIVAFFLRVYGVSSHMSLVQ